MLDDDLPGLGADLSPDRTPADPPAASSEPARRSWLKRAGRYGWPTFCLFQLGLLAGSWTTANRRGESVIEEQHPAPAAAAAISAKSSEPPAESKEPPDYALAEKLLAESDFERALPIFWPAEAEARAALAANLRFRAALCLDGLGRWHEALAAYQEVAAGSKSLPLVNAAQVCQARIHVRQKQFSEAKTLLYPLLLVTDSPEYRGSPLLTEAHFLLALALSQELAGEQRIPGLGEVLVRAKQATWPVAHSLRWDVPARKPPATLPVQGIQVLQAYGQGAEEVLIRANLSSSPLQALVEKIAGSANLKVSWSAQARDRTRERTGRLAIEGRPLPEVVQALIDALGLVCLVRGDTLRIELASDCPAEELARLRGTAARQALRGAALGDPQHGLALMAYLELGNDEAAAGKLDEAVACYERLLVETSRHPEAAAAYFNLGLVQRARKDPSSARKAFYHLVDGNPGHELTCRAYLQIGRTHQDEDQIAAAVFPLRRAVGLGIAAPDGGEAVLTLAATLLFLDRPRETNEVLRQNQPLVNRDPYRPTAAFLDALARYRVAVLEKTSRLEGADLLASLVAFQKRPALGTHGQLLVGQAYKELGMVKQMAGLYEQALPQVAGPVGEQMTFALADYLLGEHSRDRAQKLLQKLAAAPRSKWAIPATVRLASLALQEGKGQQCLTLCRRCLSDAVDRDRAAAFQLMGAAYEQLGDFENAARCFQRQMPGEKDH